MLSIIIPAYNEEKRIRATLERIIEYGRAKKTELEIIVVDDGSSDATVRVAGELEKVKIIRNPTNMGKGASVREGMKAAAGEIVLFTDADMSAPIEEADKLLDAIERGYDIAIGSRMAKPRKVNKYQPPHRIALGLAFGAVVKMLFKIDFFDTQCGFKMFTREAAQKLVPLMTVNGYTFDVEMLAIADKMGMKIAERAVEWNDVPGSKIRVLKDFPAIVSELSYIFRRLKKLNVTAKKGK